MTFTAHFVVVVPAAGDRSEQRSPCVVRGGSTECHAYGLHRLFRLGSNLLQQTLDLRTPRRSRAPQTFSLRPGGSFVSEVQTSLRAGGYGCLGGSLGHRIERACRSHLLSVRVGCGASCIQMNDQLIPLWIEKTEDVRNGPTSRELLGGGWIADMWGYTIAAAEMGLRHKLRELARVQGEDQADLPIVHYCYASSCGEYGWQWDKRNYRPWERVPDPPSEVPSVDKALIGLLNE